MARLANCPDCGHTVSKRATACPACGCPFAQAAPEVIVERGKPAGFGTGFNVGCGVIAAIVFVPVVGCAVLTGTCTTALHHAGEQAARQGAPDSTSASSTVYDAVEIVRLYVQDPGAADARWGNKRVTARGLVRRVDRGRGEDAQLVMDTTFGYLHCHFAAVDSMALADVSPGEWHVVRGKCTGHTSSGVVLTECRLRE